jgi:hypothetical protein
MEGPSKTVSAASDLKLLFSASTHFRGHLANSAQNKDITMLIEEMCNAAQAHLDPHISSPNTTRPTAVNHFNPHFSNQSSAEYHVADTAFPMGDFLDLEVGDVSLEFDDDFNRFTARLQGAENSPLPELDGGRFKS